jgi:hypothetical protein
MSDEQAIGQCGLALAEREVKAYPFCFNQSISDFGKEMRK